MKISDYVSTIQGLGDAYREQGDHMLIMYPALGLAGEVGELLDKMQLLYAPNSGLTNWGVIKEIGDCLWYTMSLAMDAGVQVPYRDYETFSEFRQATWAEPIQDYDRHYVMACLPVVVGQICEIVKKAFRDNGGIILDDKKMQLDILIGTVLRYLYRICKLLNVTMDEVAETNIGKLTSRRDRGVLHGDGDNR